MSKNKLLDNPKMPWGILAGSFAMLCSFLTIAIIAVFVISSAMYANAGSDDGLRESWWLIPVYIAEVISVAGSAFSIYCYARRKKLTAK